MKFFLLTGIFLIGVGSTFAQDTTPTTTFPVKTVAPAIKPGEIPWATWFKKNALVTDKKEYVHFFFNAQDFKFHYEGKNKSVMIAQTAAQLVTNLYPTTATSDIIKMDIVFVTKRDQYDLPKWDSLVRVAHLEFLKSAVLKNGKPKKTFSSEEISKTFNSFQLF